MLAALPIPPLPELSSTISAPSLFSRVVTTAPSAGIIMAECARVGVAAAARVTPTFPNVNTGPVDTINVPG